MAQVITVALSPVITRIYDPLAFGALGVFNAVLNLLVPVAALTYPIAIVLPKGEADARKVTLLAFLSSLQLAGAVLILLVIVGPSLISWLGLESIERFIFILPPLMVVAAAQQSAQQWLLRMRDFRPIARANILQAVVTNGMKLALGLFAPVGSVLIMATVAGRAIHGLLLVVSSKVTPWGSEFKPGGRRVVSREDATASGKSLSELRREYRDFPLYRAPEVLLGAASQGMPIVVLAALFGPTAAGLFVLCRSVLGLPSQLLGASVGDVYYPRAAQVAQEGESVTRILISTTVGLSVVGLLPYAIVAAFGPQIFSIAFGVEWRGAGEFARWVAIWLYLELVSRPTIRTLPILHAQRFHLHFSIVATILRFAALVVGYWLFGTANSSVAFFGVVGFVVNLALIVIVIGMTRRHSFAADSRLGEL